MPTHNEYVSSIPEEENGSEQAAEIRTKEKEVTEIVIVGDKRKKDKYPFWANIISLGAVIVSAFVFGVTLYLFKEAHNATEIAKQSLQQIQATDSVNRRNAAIVAHNDSIRTNNDTTHNNLSLIEQRRLADAQIRQLNEGKSEFESLNAPYLQAMEFSVNNPKGADSIVLTFNIYNIRETPVKIITKENAIVEWNNNHSEKDIVPLLKFDTTKTPLNTYIIKGTPYDDKYGAGFNSSSMKNRNDIYVYYGCQIKYLNLVTGEPRFYYFLVKLRYVRNDFTYGEYLINENSNTAFFK